MSTVTAKFFILGVILGTLAIMMTVVTETEAEKVADFPFDLAECKKVVARIAKRTLKAFGVCSRELKRNVTGDRELFQKKIGCIVKCTIGRLDLLDENGGVTRDLIQKFMDEMVPQDAHDFAHALTQECNESYGLKLDNSEEFCESYSAYGQCLQNTVADFAEVTNCQPGDANGGLRVKRQTAKWY